VISAFIPFASVLVLCVILLWIMAKGGINDAILGLLIFLVGVIAFVGTAITGIACLLGY
jgi:hypothetical protein